LVRILAVAWVIVDLLQDTCLKLTLGIV